LQTFWAFSDVAKGDAATFTISARWQVTSDEVQKGQQSYLFKEYDEGGKVISTRVYEDHFPTEWAEKLAYENFQNNISSLGGYEGQDITTIDLDALMSYSQSLNRDNVSATFDHCVRVYLLFFQ